MATGAGNVLRDMSLVRKLNGLLDPRHAPIDPVTEGQANENNRKDNDNSFHPLSCGYELATTLLDPRCDYTSEKRKRRATILF